MKRSFPANIDGAIFYIDEDAFNLLQNYLSQLKVTFTGPEGDEIVADIESRIRELFDRKIAEGKSVIILDDVNTVIATMGRPEDLNPDAPAAEPHHDSHTTPTAHDAHAPQPSDKKLYRNMRDKVFGGVLGGLAVYLGWNANIMRLLLVFIVIITTGIMHMWPFILAYLIAWMIIPPARTPRQILQMKGEPVNLDTVGQTVREDSGAMPPPVRSSADSVFNTFFTIIGKCIMALVGMVSGAISMACLAGFLAVLVGIVAYTTAGSPVILNGLSLFPSQGIMAMGAALSALMFGVVLFGFITWGCVAVILPNVRMSRAWSVSLTVLCIMLAVIAGFLLSVSFF